MNYATIYGWNNHSKIRVESSLSAFFQTTAETLFESKGWTLLAILFGYGFAALLKKISHNNQNPYLFFTKRMLWLFAFAFVNSLFYGGDILHDYALMGLILLLFYNLSVKSITVFAVAILLLTPVLQSVLGNYQLLFTPKYRDAFYELYNHHTTLESIKANLQMRYQWMLRLSYSVILHLIQLGCFLLGMAFQRSQCFERLSREPKLLLRKILFLSFVTSLMILLLQLAVENKDWKFNEYYNLYYPEALSIMVFSTAAICWLYFSGYCKTIFESLQIIGTMTLTNYILQNIIAFVLFIIIRPNWNWESYILTGIVVYTAQLYFSKWWLSQFNYGFFEWLWRCLSYQKRFAFKKEIASNK